MYHTFERKPTKVVARVTATFVYACVCVCMTYTHRCVHHGQCCVCACECERNAVYVSRFALYMHICSYISRGMCVCVCLVLCSAQNMKSTDLNSDSFKYLHIWLMFWSQCIRSLTLAPTTDTLWAWLPFAKMYDWPFCLRHSWANRSGLFSGFQTKKSCIPNQAAFTSRGRCTKETVRRSERERMSVRMTNIHTHRYIHMYIRKQTCLAVRCVLSRSGPRSRSLAKWAKRRYSLKERAHKSAFEWAAAIAAVARFHSRYSLLWPVAVALSLSVLATTQNQKQS